MQPKALVDSFSPQSLLAFVRIKSKSVVRKAAPTYLIEKGAAIDQRFHVNNDFMVIERFPKQPDESMIIMSILVDTGNLTARSCRRKQYEFSKEAVRQCDLNQITPNHVYQGIFVFYDNAGNFRFSLVHNSTPQAADTTRPDWSAFRRQTYFVKASEPNRTFVSRMSLPWNSVDDVKNAFSVEALTKEFYGELFKWYQYAVDSSDVFFPNDAAKDKDQGVVKSEQVIRLITRLMFVWFIKQKELVPDRLFNPEELKKILKDFATANGDNYYRAILQNLFFATLNSEIENRAFAVEGSSVEENKEHFDIKTLYRYREHFKIDGDQILELFKSIPFLNGGLFECLDRGRDYYDGFSRNRDKRASIPNRLFFSLDEAQPGLITILSRYNFTAEENSAGDEEVALDPELLGKVFENLLGAYNPETHVAARNATGSFYTPREIVDYMVDESLIAHLENKCGSEHSATIRKLFKEGARPQCNDSLCSELADNLTKIKILDPACGSGAFPMGALLRIVEILRILKSLQDHESVYELKLKLIEQCIFGVDIQCIAVQISKLRFFISLVCEQDRTGDACSNYGINPLPNLETKFVAANSLVRLPSGHGILQSSDIEDLKARLWEVRHLHFRARTYQEKKKLRTQDGVLRKQLTDKLESWKGFDIDAANRLAGWDPYGQNQSSSFFDAEWMFNVTSGFDIIIGNPPYIKEYTNRAAFDSLRDSPYYQGKMDLWYLFACEALDLAGELGIVAFIAQNNWITSFGASKLRNKIVSDARMVSLIDFGNHHVFEAGIQTMIMLFAKDKAPQSYTFSLRRLVGNNISQEEAFRIFNIDQTQGIFEVLNPNFCRTDQRNKVFAFSNPEKEPVLKKIASGAMFFLDNAEVAQGIVYPQDCFSENRHRVLKGAANTGDGIFVLREDELVALKLSSKERALIKPSYTSRDIHRWYADPLNREWVIYTDSRFKDFREMDEYPTLKRHLDRFGAVITSDNRPYGLHRARDERFFVGHKILVARKCAIPKFSYVDFDSYVSAAFYAIKTSRIDMKYLVALLNSKVVLFWLKNRGKMQGNNFQIDKEPLLSIPLVGRPNKSDIIVSMVNRILDIKKGDPEADITDIERAIDAEVYKLYGLSDSEVAVIEHEYTALLGQTEMAPLGDADNLVSDDLGPHTDTSMSDAFD